MGWFDGGNKDKDKDKDKDKQELLAHPFLDGPINLEPRRVLLE